jgi:hypothetical protein
LFSSVIFGHQHIYHWIDKEHVEHDPILKGKSGLLNPTFFFIWTLVTIGLWSFIGAKMRKLSERADEAMSMEEGKSFIHANTIWASAFLIFFGLLWVQPSLVMAHEYDSLVFNHVQLVHIRERFCCWMSLVALFVVYLKNNDYLEYTTDEQLHDLGKFMFAFSVFWTYLWYSQFMLIWYANIPEETVYFKPRMQGAYKGVFFLNLIVNFLLPFLLLMRKEVQEKLYYCNLCCSVNYIGSLDRFLPDGYAWSMGEHYTSVG